jgi:type IV secretion system protein VirD4
MPETARRHLHHHHLRHPHPAVSPGLRLRVPGGGLLHEADRLAADPWFWLAAAGVVVGLAAVGWAAYGLYRALLPPEGFATALNLRTEMSARAAGRKLSQTRPSLYAARRRAAGLPVSEYSWRVGRCVSPRMMVRGTPEDSAIIVGPPGSMKSVWLSQVIGEAPGAVIHTSSKAKDHNATSAARARRGPVWTLNIQRLGDVPSTLQVDMVSGCADPHTAILTGGFLLYGARRPGAFTNLDDYFHNNANEVLRCLLHAAALDGRTLVDVHRWASSPEAAFEALDILTRHGADPGWITTFHGKLAVVDKTRDGIFSTLATALQWMASPEAVRAVTPGPGQALDPEEFVASRGTLYLIGEDDGSGAIAPLFTLVISWLVAAAVRVASSSPGGRLDPWLTLALDEVATICPVPLDRWINKLRDHGILPIAAIQSRAQLADRWGPAGAEVIWNAAAYTLTLRGVKSIEDARALSELCGEREHTRHALSHGPQGVVRTRHTELRPVLPPHKIRMLRRRRMLVLYRGAKPTIVLVRRPWLAPAAWLRGRSARGQVPAAATRETARLETT